MRVVILRVYTAAARRPASSPGALGHYLRDERGVTVVIVTLALAALMGMVVLVVDVGGLLTLRRRMVLAADAAALAAAQSCGMNNAAEAPDQADELATANQSDAHQTGYESTECGGPSSGEVRVGYAAPKTLIFGPVIGAPNTRPVSAAATAVWGPAGGISPVPIELSIDPAGQVDCAYKELGTTCAYWHDNSADHDLNSSSNWGFMNLELAGVDPDDTCPNAGTSERRDWINATLLTPIKVMQDGVTLVCADSGHSTSSWYSALTSQVGKVKYFPINDPAQMVMTSGKEKYAIIGFIPLRVDHVLKGNDPEAVGDPGTSGRCSGSHSFTPGDVFDLDSLGCYAEADSISDLTISAKKTAYRDGTDYTFDPVSHEVTWFTSAAPNASIEFNWSAVGASGRCGNRPPDPNAVCLVLSWQGVRVAGSLPGNGADFGLRAVRLDG